MHRDIGTLGHWNPECTGRGKGTDLRAGNGHRPEERHFSGIPSGVVGGFSAAWFMAKPLMEVTTSWVGACCSQVQFLVSFSRDSKGRCGPAAPVELSGRRRKRELEGGALSSTLEKTDGGSRLREERLLTDGGGRVTVALRRRRL